MNKKVKIGDKVDLLSCYEESPRGGRVVFVGSEKAWVVWREGLRPDVVALESLAVSE